MLKNYAYLTEEENEKLQQILSQSPSLRIAYCMKEELREIYQTTTTVQTGIIRMKKWLTQARVFYSKVARTISTHKDKRSSSTSSGSI